MAIIYSYPEIPDVQGGDLLLISDTGAPNKPTRSVDIDDLAAYIGTVVGVVQNLQSVLTVGNTYVSPDGYGTFTLNDITNSGGQIKYVNTDEGWGYALNAEEGLNFTDGNGDFDNGKSSFAPYAVWIGNGTHQAQISSNNLTASRIFQLPNASGTIALTSDIPAPGPSGSGTTNYTARWTNASTLGIGALYDNGTSVGIGINGTYASPPQRLTVVSDDSIQPVAQFKNIGTGGGLFVRTDGTTRPLFELFSGSSYRVVVTGAGNLGIGTTSPSQKLEVIGNVKVSSTIYSPNLATWGNVPMTIRSDDYIRFLTSSSNNERMRILNNGNIGIGTTSPSAKLHIEDSISNGSVFKITTSTSGALQPVFDARISSNGDTYYDLNAYKSATKKIQIKSANTSYIQQVDGTGGFDIKGHLKTSLQTVNGGGVLQLHRYGALSLNDDASYTHQPASALYINTLYNTSTDYLMLLANQGSDKLAVDLNGNVGIGTTSPSEKLDVRGNVRIETGLPSITLKNTAGFAQDYSIANQGNLIVEKNGLDGGGSFIIKDENGKTPLDVSMGLLNPDIIASGDLIVKNKTGTTTNLYVQEYNGNVGIGTTSPLSKLNVNGDIKIEGENELYFGSSGSVPLWEIKASGSDLVINDTGSNVGSVLFNNDEGIVLPRLTTTEINAISLPNTGLTVYNTTLNTICFYNGSSWQKVNHANM